MAVPAALLGAVLLTPATGAAAAPMAAAQPVAATYQRSQPRADDLPRLQRELAATTRRAQELADRLEQAAARDGGLRVAAERLATAHDDAQARLDARVREVYMAEVPDPLQPLRNTLTEPGLQRLAEQGQAAALRVDQHLVQDVSQQSAQVVALQSRADGFRAGLRAQATAVLVAQDQARALLARAREVAAREQARAAARLATAEQAAARSALARLEAEQATLDQVSAGVTRTLAPVPTRRSSRAQSGEGPVMQLVGAAGSGYPRGYAPTGQVITGSASWYGPGFVGSPTASGAPYNPELLTCANKEVPLGTVLHVSANGRAVNCLVNDRGPYVGARVLDMSRAGSRALGYDGVATVVIQFLAPV